MVDVKRTLSLSRLSRKRYLQAHPLEGALRFFLPFLVIAVIVRWGSNYVYFWLDLHSGLRDLPLLMAGWVPFYLSSVWFVLPAACAQSTLEGSLAGFRFELAPWSGLQKTLFQFYVWCAQLPVVLLLFATIANLVSTAMALPALLYPFIFLELGAALGGFLLFRGLLFQKLPAIVSTVLPVLVLFLMVLSNPNFSNLAGKPCFWIAGVPVSHTPPSAVLPVYLGVAGFALFGVLVFVVLRHLPLHLRPRQASRPYPATLPYSWTTELRLQLGRSETWISILASLFLALAGWTRIASTTMVLFAGWASLAIGSQVLGEPRTAEGSGWNRLKTVPFLTTRWWGTRLIVFLVPRLLLLCAWAPSVGALLSATAFLFATIAVSFAFGELCLENNIEAPGARYISLGVLAWISLTWATGPDGQNVAFALMGVSLLLSGWLFLRVRSQKA